MKKWVLFVWCASCTITAVAQETGFTLAGIGSLKIPVTLDKMTNIILPQPVLAGVRVSRDILACKVHGVENVIELKAMRRRFPETNLSVYGEDGRLYSFVLQYSDDTTVLNYRVIPDRPDDSRMVSTAVAGSPIIVPAGGDATPLIQPAGLPAPPLQLRRDADNLAAQRFFMHHARCSGGITLRVGGVYVSDSLLWLALSLRNHSPVGFKPLWWRFYLEETKRIRRRAIQQVPKAPVIMPPAQPVPAGRCERLAIGFFPFTVPRGQRLLLDITAQDSRRITLRIRNRQILRAHDRR
jgi:hypothetical protein